MSLSQPEFAADGKTIGALVYFSSASENTARFVAGCRLPDEGINVYRIPLRAADPAPYTTAFLKAVSPAIEPTTTMSATP